MKELINKYGLIVLSIIAIIALFFPMASVTIDTGWYDSTMSVSGFDVAFQKYYPILLIVGPAGIIAAHFLNQLQAYKKKLMFLSPIVGVIVTVATYFTAVNVASAGDSEYADVTASMGTGGVLCLIAHIATGLLVYLQNKEEINALVGQLKNK